MQLFNKSYNLILIEKYVHNLEAVFEEETMIFYSTAHGFDEAMQGLKNVHLSVLFNHWILSFFTLCW